MPAPRNCPTSSGRAVREVQNSGRPVAQVARHLGIHWEALRLWVRQRVLAKEDEVAKRLEGRVSPAVSPSTIAVSAPPTPQTSISGSGSSRWPRGVLGGIRYSRGYRASAAARSTGRAAVLRRRGHLFPDRAGHG
ncbi:transposase [Streptomyces sp. NPDC017230]|uniref:transposase n=1 Tax=unclassified Streptomyces TaxID=2593676 RepID=UPI0037A2AA93